jgi:tricorn protease
MIVKKNNDYYVTSVDKAFSGKSMGDKLSLDKMTYRIKPQEEWNQIFSDTWRWYRDFFYDVNMHGRDWKKIGDGYRRYINQLTSRQDLNWLLSQMVGELCVSHTYVGGGDNGPQMRPEDPVFTGLLGVDMEKDASGYYKLVKIYGPTDFNREVKNPLVRPDLQLAEGDFLISINGKEIRYPENPYKYLLVTKGQKIKIAVNDKPTMSGARSAEIEPIHSERDLRYNRWVADNIAQVAKASEGDVGYMHMTAMGSGNLGQLDKFWRAFRYKKGLVIDVRGNGGGWIEYFVIDKLERQQVAYNNMQGMEAFRYPNSASRAQYAVITNEYNGSDGEAFIEHFKARKLGTVIGVPSWGGLVGIINGQKTIDNGTVQQSNNAFYGREGKWLVENHGADPDIYLENDPASEIAGRDLQLEKAVETLQKQVKEKPWTFPAKPAYPKP